MALLMYDFPKLEFKTVDRYRHCLNSNKPHIFLRNGFWTVSNLHRPYDYRKHKLWGLAHGFKGKLNLEINLTDKRKN